MFGEKSKNLCIHLWKDKRGSMTVEATYIIPLIILLFSMVLFLFMFYLDMIYAKSMTVQISDEVAQAWKVDGDIDTGSYQPQSLMNRSSLFLIKRTSGKVVSQGEAKLRKSLSKALVLTKVDSCDVSISGMSVVASVQLSFRGLFGGMARWIGANQLTFTGKTKVSLDYREELLRLIGGD